MNVGGSNLPLTQKMLELMEAQKEGRGAGLSAAVLIGGELVAACAAGKRGEDGSPAEIGDLYNVGSVSKVYCAAAVMKLVDQGLVELDAPVVRYLPRFVMRDARYKDITVRMTLNHASGLPGSNYRKAVADHWVGDRVMEENYAYWAQSKLKADPGRFSVYCNEGFELAAAIVETVTGRRFIDFLRESVTTPAGAPSTGEAEVAIGTSRMMSCVGQKPEWLTAIGAGAIRTTLADCARFGYLFLHPNGILSEESLRELRRPQGATFLKKDVQSPLYGLGWDNVEDKNASVDLGEHVLGKGGGTGQFSSYLLVCPQYDLAAAISGTHDCGTNNTQLLYDLVALALRERGIETARAPESEQPPCTAVDDAFLAQHSGVYYSSSQALRPTLRDGKLVFTRYAGNGAWEDHTAIEPLELCGAELRGEHTRAFFEETEQNEYLFVSLRHFLSPLAQRPKTRFTLTEGWKKRLGKRYLACNMAASDAFAPNAPSCVVEELDGVLLFGIPGEEYAADIVRACGDDDTDMFLDAPFMGSRDQCTPQAFTEGGIEYLRCGATVYIDADCVPVLAGGTVRSECAECNALYRTKAGMRVRFDKPEHVATYLLGSDLRLLYCDLKPGEWPETMPDGYLIFANDAPMEFDVTVEA